LMTVLCIVESLCVFLKKLQSLSIIHHRRGQRRGEILVLIKYNISVADSD